MFMGYQLINPECVNQDFNGHLATENIQKNSPINYYIIKL